MSGPSTIFLAVLGILLLAPKSGCEEKASAQPIDTLTSMGALDRMTPIKKNDMLIIQILEDKREALHQYVAATGEVLIPYIGLMKAEGLTCHDLAFRSKAELEKDFFKTATVLVRAKQEEKQPPPYCPGPWKADFVIVSGAVKKQGKYELPPDQDTTVAALVQRAGGYANIGFNRKIYIIRRTPLGNKRILVNTKRALIQKSPEYDLFLRRYDVVIVE